MTKQTGKTAQRNILKSCLICECKSPVFFQCLHRFIGFSHWIYFQVWTPFAGILTIQKMKCLCLIASITATATLEAVQFLPFHFVAGLVHLYFACGIFITIFFVLTLRCSTWHSFISKILIASMDCKCNILCKKHTHLYLNMAHFYQSLNDTVCVNQHFGCLACCVI